MLGKSFRRAVFLDLVLTLCVAIATASNSDRHARLELSLGAVDAALSFFSRHRSSANLDGVIGVRIVQGQFGALLSARSLPGWLSKRLRAARNVAAEVADAMEQLEKAEAPGYYAVAGPVISRHHWDRLYASRSLVNLTPGARRLSNDDRFSDDVDENLGDQCVRDLVRSDGIPQCRITERCWTAMAEADGTSGYYLTHQVYYLMNGIQFNCEKNMTARATRATTSSFGSEQQPLLSLIDRKCAQVDVEAMKLEKLNFPIQHRDLFLEQIALCGNAGYSSVLAKRRWLPLVAAWQRADTGCYGLFQGEKSTTARKSGTLRRQKRVEQLMTAGGCLSHRTAVALGALVAFVRRDVEEGVEEGVAA